MNIEQLLSTLENLAQNDNTLLSGGRPPLSISTEAGHSGGFCVSETVYDAVHRILHAYVGRELRVLLSALENLDAQVDREITRANNKESVKELETIINHVF